MILAKPDSKKAPLTHEVVLDSAYYLVGPQQGHPPEGNFEAGMHVHVDEETLGGSYVWVTTETGLSAWTSFRSLRALAIECSSTVIRTPDAAAKTCQDEAVYTHEVACDTKYYFIGPQQARPPEGSFQKGMRVYVADENIRGSYAWVTSERGLCAWTNINALRLIHSDPSINRLAEPKGMTIR